MRPILSYLLTMRLSSLVSFLWSVNILDSKTEIHLPSRSTSCQAVINTEDDILRATDTWSFLDCTVQVCQTKGSLSLKNFSKGCACLFGGLIKLCMILSFWATLNILHLYLPFLWPSLTLRTVLLFEELYYCCHLHEGPWNLSPNT